MIKFIKIDVENNTVEVTKVEPVVVDGQTVSYQSSSCVNYSKEQKADFLTEVEGAENYLGALGW